MTLLKKALTALGPPAPSALPCPVTLSEALEPWWRAVSGADVLGEDSALIQLWGGQRVLDALPHAEGLPGIPIGDDGLGRWLWLLTPGSDQRAGATAVLHPDELRVLHEQGQAAESGGLDLEDWIHLITARKPHQVVRELVAQHPERIERARLVGALGPVLLWHPRTSLRKGHEERELRRALRMLGPLPPGTLIDEPETSRNLCIDDSYSAAPELLAFLQVTRTLTTTRGPFRLLCGGSDQSRWHVEETWWRLGGERFGHEVWISPEYGGIQVVHSDRLLEGDPEEILDDISAFSPGCFLHEIVALEAQLAPLTGSVGVEGSRDEILAAVSRALNYSTADALGAVKHRDAYIFLRDAVGV